MSTRVLLSEAKKLNGVCGSYGWIYPYRKQLPPQRIKYSAYGSKQATHGRPAVQFSVQCCVERILGTAAPCLAVSLACTA